MSPLEMLLRPILERAVRFDSDCASVDELDEQLARTTAEVIEAVSAVDLVEEDDRARILDTPTQELRTLHIGGTVPTLEGTRQ